MEAYPYYIDGAANEFEIAYWCPEELASWRAIKARHKAATSVERKLRIRPELERAYATLRTAYLAAINQDAAVCVA